MESSATLLERFHIAHGRDINLTLRSAYTDLLEAFDHPEENLPPTLVVAGTNGKGSTCAFLRAMIEAEGRAAHVYSSPSLVRFHERIRIAGQLITEEELTTLLLEAERLTEKGSISFFEVGTIAALVAFSRHKADATILEVGLGGRLDATNVVPDPVGTVIARLSFDHCEYLGDTMDKIAREKAGIMRPRTPCFVAPQPSQEALSALRDEAAKLDAPLVIGGKDWRIEEQANGCFTYIGPMRTITDLPRPALVGAHQLWNAGLAIAASAALPFALSDASIRKAMTSVAWEGRLQHLTSGALVDRLPATNELWLDGGHNDSAAEVLAAQMAAWQAQDGRPLDLIYGMLSTKNPKSFITPLLPYIRSVTTLTIQGEVAGYTAQELATQISALGVQNVTACASLNEALKSLSTSYTTPSRTLVCGSLVLVGDALRLNANR